MLGVVVIGVLVGSAIAAKASGEFRVRISGATQVVKSIAGGLCMDIGVSWAGGALPAVPWYRPVQLPERDRFLFYVPGASLVTEVFVVGFTRRFKSLGRCHPSPSLKERHGYPCSRSRRACMAVSPDRDSEGHLRTSGRGSTINFDCTQVTGSISELAAVAGYAVIDFRKVGGADQTITVEKV
ncbi:hypothetical protein E5345_05560 [Propionibacterium sp. NM47_B9-13]|jgi:hypothetical protein|uniref:Uncharacterized protein n=2 Tax=Cutibacterium modestum TaxID=2559073 RepID=A0AAD1KQL2_9ACTN|nr:YeeE/YedE thiosulfate transporter family protein [Cutibacterium modestum]TGY29650.1 hypothetical protein E5345_05560 [Propionibacterium sp. NM47_B9-13]AOH46569.1 hypothetical protein BCB70_01355 [Cutibacterium modestum]EFS74950.1 hypothetical protein HMPREF9621_00581 [Cutibacterium modestum HL037PA2]EFS91577.1 hypothetical protein HMPREF9607_02083 [Cutibacterium modestum HL044PA1]EFT16104.1 hypothetical protein HMPREF9622_00965 [Cutibacterium modestum HL037PA3]